MQMRFFSILTTVLMFGQSLWAHGSAVYYVGEQISPLSAPKECFVEAVYSDDHSAVTLRAVLANSHEGEVLSVGPLTANYQFIGGAINSNAYYFEDATAGAQIRRLILVSAQPESPTQLQAAVFHHNHYDPVACQNLVLAQDEELHEAEEVFEHFGEDGHSHEH